MRKVNPELGEKLGLTRGDTVEVITDLYEGIVADKGEHGWVQSFAIELGVIFTYVEFATGPGVHGFPFFPSEIKKVKASPDGD
ncbi:hypothetical protein [Streptomyces asiaticus]|uniref:hypothetical protein n=1 Tax=Streptomyces asiaticus TaxID=114695 RepID=UPI003F66D83B